MAKLKADWLKEAKALGLKLTPKDKIADIRAAISAVNSKAQTVKSKDSSAPTPISELPSPKLAKAGRRSKKGIEEAEVKAEKEARKRGELAKSVEAATPIKKGPVPVTKSRLERRSKRYKQAAALIDSSREYDLTEAVKLAVDSASLKFDSALELHVRLNADPKQSDQNIRATVALPHGTGKTLRVAVFAEDADQAKAEQAGADVVGDKDLIDNLSKGQIDFDVLISTPQMMSQLGRFAKVLGPKGLMPNPKSGTVTKNVAAAVKQAKAGQVEFRIDKQGIVHLAAGKTSFGVEKLLDNLKAVLTAIKAAKPASIKSQYVLSAHLTTTMGPSVKLSAAGLLSQAESK